MDSLFRTRGSGVSSDVENTIVPQLLTEIDGVEGLENVIVIGASNREDMIDPAILRPGRLDVKIKIERPDAEAARDIFSQVPHADAAAPRRRPGRARRHAARPRSPAMIQRTVERMYTETEENRFLEVTYANGDKEVLYFKDFNSGAMIAEHRRPGQEDGDQGLPRARRRGACGSAPARGLRRRVQGERGPAQHDEPRRLGAHLRQEGRADRLHPHAGPAARAPRPAAPSTPSPTPASTCNDRPPTGSPLRRQEPVIVAGRAAAGRPAVGRVRLTWGMTVRG